MEHDVTVTKGDIQQTAESDSDLLRTKVFVASWDDSFDPAGERVQLEQDFNAQAGYTEDDIERIRSLRIGESWTCPDYGRAHTVTRLPDERMSNNRLDDIRMHHPSVTPDDAESALARFRSGDRVPAAERLRMKP